MPTLLQAVLRHAGELQRITRLSDLLRVTHEALCGVTRYRHSWLALFDPDDPEHLRIVQIEGAMQAKVLSDYPLVPRKGDAMLAELELGRAPVVVLDAPADPRTNKVIVAALGNRTIINVPMPGGTALLGALGVGTFGDEGVLAPTDRELEALTIYAIQLGGAVERIRLLDEKAQEFQERRSLERHLEALERMELLGMLASGVAHDLNNTLAVISSSLGSLDLPTLSEDDREAVSDSRTAAARAIEVVGQLQALGRPRPGRREDVDLNARVTSTLRLVRSSIPHAVALHHEAGVAPLVAGDPAQIEHALANLVINARDAVAGRGTIRIQVDEQQLDGSFAREHRWARPGRFARVLVHDTGAGLPPEVLARLSDPLFVREPASGLGLAVVSRVVHQHDGLLCCESKPGAGTTFGLYLPAR